MQATIVLLPGDGIGPEVVAAARLALEAAAERFGHAFDFEELPVGGAAVDACGQPLPEATLAACRAADAVLLGAVGGPKWSGLPGAERPEAGLLALRREMGLFANLRPIKTEPEAAKLSPLKPGITEGVDLLFVRELTGGLYFGEKSRDAERARDVCDYSVEEIERLVRLGADLARKRRKKLTSIDKSNVLETSRLWRQVVDQVVGADYPDLELEHLLVDAAAMHLLTRPADFDVLVTENLFGDILTDEASVLAGAIGLVPSASLGAGKAGLYEPIHGSAPDIAGQQRANPLGMISSAAMMLELSLDLAEAAAALRAGVSGAIAEGTVTSDLGGTMSTQAVARAVAESVTEKG